MKCKLMKNHMVIHGHSCFREANKNDLYEY